MAPPRAGDILSFDATIYEVRISPDQISRLDVDALTKVAGTAESFEKALAALGDMRPLYRANESGSFNEEHYVKIGTAPPEAPATKPAAGRGPLPPGAHRQRSITSLKQAEVARLNSISLSKPRSCSTPRPRAPQRPILRRSAAPKFNNTEPSHRKNHFSSSTPTLPPSTPKAKPWC